MDLSDALKWAADTSKVEMENDGKDIMKYQHIMGFFLVWPIYETDLFNNHVTEDRFKKKAEKLFEMKFDPECCREEIDHFLNRYDRSPEGETNFMRLCMPKDGEKEPKEKIKEDIQKIRDRGNDILTPQERILFLSYVIYRFRNNLFHGNTYFDRWEGLEKEVNYCTSAMMKIRDFYMENKDNCAHSI